MEDAQDAPVSVSNVEVVSDDGMGLIRCHVDGRDFDVPRYNLLRGSGDTQVGARGVTLVLPRWFAENLGIVRSQPIGHSYLDDLAWARRILVVEDDEESRNTLCALLECWGHHVVSADSGEQALAFAVMMRLDAIVLDFALRDMDGRDFVRALRGAGLSPSPLIVGYSSMPKAAVDAQEVALDAFMPNPDARELERLFGPPAPAAESAKPDRPQ